MTYSDNLNARIQDYRNRASNDEVIDPALPFIELDWSQDHSSYFAALVRSKIVTRRIVSDAVASAKQRSNVQAFLNDVPDNARDYARLYSRKLNITVSYRGAISIPGNSCSTILDYTRGARLTAQDLGLRFGRESINDAIEEHYAEARDEALNGIRDTIEDRASFDWEKLAQGCFDNREVSPALVAAVLRKFIWQVKRKLHGLPVSHHLMAVLFGAQGLGKSWFINLLCAPIGELTSFSDFGAIGDDRNIDLWRSYAIVFDEMARMAKADIEVIKHVITADSLERRPMRTNSSVTVRQCATFIGSSNMSLAELIRDETGNRRFIELTWGKPDHAFVNGFDYSAAWRSVHQTDADPMLDYMDELEAIQADSRNSGPVESWLMHLQDEGRWSQLLDRADRKGFIRTQILFEAYLDQRQDVNGGTEREHRSLSTFGQELKRLTKLGDFGLTSHRTATGNGWLIDADKVAGSANEKALRIIGGRAR